MGDPELHPILNDRQYVLSSLTLTIVTGLTLNHNRILLGYCLGYGENADDTRCFLQFLLANGGKSMNNKRNIIMSDRGACAGPVDEVFTRAVHHYCPKHLERNLQGPGHGYSKEVLELFWEARQAKTETAYKAAMKKMEKHSSGGKSASVYLKTIPYCLERCPLVRKPTLSS